MTETQVALWVQVAAVLAAVGAAVIALVISARDRAETRRIASKDRQLSRLMFDMEMLLRLLENYNRGGSADAQEADRLWSEALTLVGALGPGRLPASYAEKVDEDEELRALLADDEMPEWKKEAIRVQLALNVVAREIQEVTKDKQREPLRHASSLVIKSEFPN